MSREENSKVLRNAGWIIACKAIQSIINLVITMISARYLGPSNYGVLNYAASVVAIFVPIMQLGLRSTLVQEYIQNVELEGTVFGTSTLMMLISALICMLGVAILSICTSYNEKETVVVCILYSGILLFQATEMIQYWFQARLQSKYTSVVSLCVYVLVSIYKVYLLATDKNIYWFAISNVLDCCLISIALYAIFRKKSVSKISFSVSLARKLFNKSKYYIISSVMVTVFGHIGSVAIALFCGKEEVGYYTAAVTCAGMTGFIFNAIIDSTRPIILSYRENSSRLYKKSIESLYTIIFYSSILQSIIMCSFANLIVDILYGSEYYESATLLRVISWYTFFSYVGPVRNIWILAEAKQKYLWIINLSGAFFSVIANIVLVPFFGGVGAAFAALLTQFFTNIIMNWWIKPLRFNLLLMLNGIKLRNMVGVLKKITKKDGHSLEFNYKEEVESDFETFTD